MFAVMAWTSPVVGCSTALGLSDYVFRADDGDSGASDANARDGSSADAAMEAARGDAPADAFRCDVDLSSQCYPCTPAAQAHFLNACTSASCVPFDDRTRLAHLLPDGALPPLPAPPDAGEQ
jgi:hypothetical protein